MKKISVKDLNAMQSAEIRNAESLNKRTAKGVSTDSRSVGKDEIFFALRGDKFDAHNFIDDVIQRNVAGVVVNKEWAEQQNEKILSMNCVCVTVPDTTSALGELATIYRRKFDIPIIAVGGSNGKTTTKEMITAVLKSKYNVLSTEGNLNNHIGVPQTLFRLTRDHDAAVVELGTNHFGEMKYLCSIAEPTHGVITNIGKEHLEFFGDEEGVAREEKELFLFLDKNNGCAFINSDDSFLDSERKKMKKSVSYGRNSKADIRAKKIETNELGQSRFHCVWPKKGKSLSVTLSVPGDHNVTNALAAISIGLKLKVKEKKIAAALLNFSSASKRMEVLSHNGIIILNDTYNSNPDSVMAALKTLMSFKTSGRTYVVLGDMRELGESSKREHTNIGVVASEMKFSKLFTFGPFSKYTAEAFGQYAAHFESKEELGGELKKVLQSGDVVLIKGSRGMKMEDVVSQITETFHQTSALQ
jgi:UDP-N-acetylmuramoyl-tripeptide--D-alanyl-D-alanine ligase